MVDNKLVKETLKAGMIESRIFIDNLEKMLGREQLYRFLFNYPKKWSKRKVKKRGARDIEFTRLDYGCNFAIKKVKALGGEYSQLFPEVEGD